ncbi:unnamed protein product [Colias eurytheme]|nr:unnamed protein product [Colias eurytheme]
METILKDGMCRCCASEGTFKDFTASYQWMGVEEVYSDMLKDCFDITNNLRLVSFDMLQLLYGLFLEKNIQ